MSALTELYLASTRLRMYLVYTWITVHFKRGYFIVINIGVYGLNYYMKEKTKEFKFKQQIAPVRTK